MCTCRGAPAEAMLIRVGLPLTDISGDLADHRTELETMSTPSNDTTRRAIMLTLVRCGARLDTN